MALLNQTPQEYYEGSDHGNYQHITLTDVINNFMVAYIGDDKIIGTAKRSEVAFHAQRALQELSYDTLRSIKDIELDVPPSLSIKLPHDYVNYVKVTFVGDDGLERFVMPRSISSTPNAGLQDDDYNLLFDESGEILYANKSNTETNFHDSSTDDNSNLDNTIDFLEEGYGYNVDYGKRYGIIPELATKHGTFFINQNKGLISFSGDFTGRTVVLKYISDGLATEDDMKLHKFAEDAIYKYISYAIISTKQDAPEYRVQRLRKDSIAARRKAKLRLSNLKTQELEQIMRGKGKQIKH
jgi:hypothetical protein